jgi:hypothetical protein
LKGVGAAAVCRNAVIAGTIASSNGSGIAAPTAFSIVRRERARFAIIIDVVHGERRAL